MSEVWQPNLTPAHPPFGPGNEMAMRHGFYSPRRIDPIAGQFVEGILADPGTSYLQAGKWRPALWALGRAEAQIQLLSEYLAKCAEEAGNGVGDLDADRVRTAYLLLHRAETRAATLRTQLGLTPLAAARLGRDRAAGELDMAKLMAELEKRDDHRRREGTDDEEAADGVE